jgi:hypothetical protein
MVQVERFKVLRFLLFVPFCIFYCTRSIHNFWDWCCHLYNSCSLIQWYVVVLAYLGSQCTEFYAAGWRCWFFAPLYLESSIWPDVILRRIQQRNSEFASNFVQILEELLWVITSDESWIYGFDQGRATVLPMEETTPTETKKCDRWRAKSRAYS